MIFIVRIRRHCVSALNTVIQIIKLACRRRLLLVVLLAATTTVLVFTVYKLKLLFLPAPSRYVTFGVDRHPSVLRLLHSDILVTRLYDDDHHHDRMVETVGVFVVMGLSTSRRTLPQPAIGSRLGCLPSYRYQIFIITSVTTESSDPLSRTSEDRKQYGDDDVNNAARQFRRGCTDAGSMSVIVWHVQVSGNFSAHVVADLLTEAYVDNITWYDVIFFPRMTSAFPVWDRWPPTELSLPSYVGVAVKTVDVGTRIAFHRTHLDIFGDSWPPWLRTGADVARYLKDVYANSSAPSYNTSSSLDSVVRHERTWLRRQVYIVYQLVL